MSGSKGVNTSNPRFLPVLTIASRVILGVTGTLILSIGVYGLLRTLNEAGTVAALSVGAALLFISILAPDVESIDVGGIKANFSATQASIVRAKQVLNSDPDGATMSAQQASLYFHELSETYIAIRQRMWPGRTRNAAFEGILYRARKLARLAGSQARVFEASEVIDWANRGNPGERVIGLAVMYEIPDYREPKATLNAVEKPYSAFEQYHALRLLVELAPTLDGEDTAKAKEIARKIHWRLRLRADKTRGNLLNEVLNKLPAR